MQYSNFSIYSASPHRSSIRNCIKFYDKIRSPAKLSDEFATPKLRELLLSKPNDLVLSGLTFTLDTGQLQGQ